jgi:hypothetical protein
VEDRNSSKSKRDQGCGRRPHHGGVPYLCYARKDRQTKPRDPVTTRYVAELFEAVGTDRLITLEVDNVAAFQNALRCDTEHLDANAIFARHLSGLVGNDPVAVLSPDSGGVKRAGLFRQRLERTLARPLAFGFMEKHRTGRALCRGRELRTSSSMISSAPAEPWPGWPLPAGRAVRERFILSRPMAYSAPTPLKSSARPPLIG